MSRNKIKTQQHLFDLIKIHLDLSSPEISSYNLNAIRYVKHNANENHCLIHLKIKCHVNLTRQIKFAIVDIRNEKFLITIGLGEPKNLPVAFVQENINAGIFTAIVADLEVPIRENISDNYLVENILSQSMDDPLYYGHDLIDLKRIFEPIYCIKINTNFGGDVDNIYQLIGYYLTANPDFIPLKYTAKTYEELHNLIGLNSNILSYDTIVQSLFSSQYKFAFLDLYRCLELLYQLVYIDETYNKLTLNTPKYKLLETIEENLGWKPNERAAILKIFSKTDINDLKHLKQAIKNIDPKITKLSDWIYDLRCNVVHLKSIQKKYELSDHHWKEIIYGVIVVLQHWYNKLNSFH